MNHCLELDSSKANFWLPALSVPDRYVSRDVSTGPFFPPHRNKEHLRWAAQQHASIAIRKGPESHLRCFLLEFSFVTSKWRKKLNEIMEGYNTSEQPIEPMRYIGNHHPHQGRYEGAPQHFHIAVKKWSPRTQGNSLPLRKLKEFDRPKKIL